MDEYEYTEESSSADDNAVWHPFIRKLAEKRTIFLYNSIDAGIAKNIIPAILYLDGQSSEDPIKIYINSDGGDIVDLFAIYDVLQMVKSPIQTVCVGRAYSSAALILASGTKGMRYISPTANIMIHHLQVESLNGSKTQVDIEIEQLERDNKIWLELLARHTGQTFSQINEDCANDKYMSPKEAVSYGIVDKIIKPATRKPPLFKEKKRRYKRKSK